MSKTFEETITLDIDLITQLNHIKNKENLGNHQETIHFLVKRYRGEM